MDTEATIRLMYVGLGFFAYVVILFLTWRDLIIFRRTGFLSYRKGAFKGIIASTIVLAGIFLTMMAREGTIPLGGLGVIFLGLLVNQKGKREPVFTTAKTLDRFLGRTDIVRTKEEIREENLRQQNELKRMEREIAVKKRRERREQEEKAKEEADESD